MRCPWCGSPVMIRGSRWECGWCGDFGNLKQTPPQQPVQITLTLSVVCHVDLPETWNALKEALSQLAPGNALLSQLLGKVLLHHISAGIRHAGVLPDEKKAAELRSFLHTAPDLNLGESTEEIMRDVRRGFLFCAEGALSEADCGTFWAELLSARPAEDYYNNHEPHGLYELFSELSSAYAYFGGKKDEELDEAQKYQNALEEAYQTHRQNKVLLHPDAERAKRLLAQGIFPDCEDICREILLAEYPEEVPHETAEDVEDLSWDGILDGVFAGSMAKGLEMWRRLLDIAEPSLKTCSETAAELLLDWEWLDFAGCEQMLPFWIALHDERFASQLFESAFIGRLQLDILGACRNCGQVELGQHCLALALKNPCLEERWEKRLRQVFTAAPPCESVKPCADTAEEPSADAKPDDGPMYRYCTVQVPGVWRPYAYLTGGLPLKAGDWVEVPFGKADAPQKGQVTEVMDCTRAAAPWPPEQTKTVLRTTDAPPTEPAAEAAAPKIEKRASQPENTPGKPVLPAPGNAEIGAAPSKKPFPRKKLIAAVLAIAVIAGIVMAILLHHGRQRAAAYAATLQELSDGHFAFAGAQPGNDNKRAALGHRLKEKAAGEAYGVAFCGLFRYNNRIVFSASTAAGKR